MYSSPILLVDIPDLGFVQIYRFGFNLTIHKITTDLPRVMACFSHMLNTKMLKVVMKSYTFLASDFLLKDILFGFCKQVKNLLKG